jgi:hypothetical protein
VKLLLMILLGILGLNLILIVGITVVLVLDHLKLRRKESSHDASTETS